jgi:hypothetical protein
MANTIRIKRTTTSNRPASLANAELAFIEGSNILVYGTGTGGAGGTATSIVDIGGTGAFLGLSNSLTQTAAGTYTFSGGVTFSSTVALGASATATTPAADDNSTAVATTAYVQNEIAGLGAGSVTSVGLSLPNIFTVSGSPVTSSGTLSATLANQAANAVFAGPTTGSNAGPSFRALVAADIPDLSATYLTVSTASSTYLTQTSAASTYAPLASPALSGTPTAPTAAALTNSTQIATTAYVDSAVSSLVDAAPAALNTLNELAAALGDDANFATTISTSLGGKLTTANNLSELTATASTARTNLGLGSIATQAANNVAITGGTIDGVTIDGGSYS